MTARKDRMLCSPKHAQDTNRRSTLFIEVKLYDNVDCDPFIRFDDVRNEVRKWLPNYVMQVKVGQHIDTSSLSCGKYVHCLKIVDHSSISPSDVYYAIKDNYLDIAVYALFQDEDEETRSSQNGDDCSVQFTVTQLPHKALDGLWEALIYEEPIPETLLRVVTRMMRISKELQLNPAVVCWHNLILLYGPPGSGKTSLAQALAQKLAIRLAHVYSATKLIAVNCHTLLSKWLGESSKMVGKLFDTILSISSDESLLTVVIIDEVETLAGSREKASQTNELGDAIRSTNELLQGLDRLRRRSNVIFICTSNLKDDMDAAFLDRCGIKQQIRSPTVECGYEIFRSVINELIRNGLVTLGDSTSEKDIALSPHTISYEDPVTGGLPWSEATDNPIFHPSNSSSLPLRSARAKECASPEPEYIPTLYWVELHLFNCQRSPPQELKRLARLAEGMSGRTLRRLPVLALAQYTVDEPCNVTDLIDALERVIKQESNQGSGEARAVVEETTDTNSDSGDSDSDDGDDAQRNDESMCGAEKS